jgi:hypothetical protein
VGQIGFAERTGYTAIGTVCNLAARRCAEAQDGHILVARASPRRRDAFAELVFRHLRADACCSDKTALPRPCRWAPLARRFSRKPFSGM